MPLCLVALFLLSFSGVVLNAGVYARIAPYFGIGRELSTGASGVLFVIVAFVAVKKPALFELRQISIAIIAVLALGTPLLIMALQMQDSTFIMVGLLCRSIGYAWSVTVFSVALCRVSSNRMVLVTVGLGEVASSLCGMLVTPELSITATCLLVMGCSVLSILITVRAARPGFDSIQRSGASQTFGIHGWSEFGGLKNLLLCMLLVGVASGYSLTFNEAQNAPVVTVWESIVLVVVIFVVLAGDPEKDENEDKLFSLVALLIIAGFLVAPLSFGMETTITNTLLRAGRDCFTVLIWLVLASLGKRNIFTLLPAMGAVRCASAAGTDVGAVAGHLTNGYITTSPLTAQAITVVFVFAFIAFLWLGFREFSFTTAIKGVKQVEAADLSDIGDRIESSCRQLAAENGLTERETEILVLLARGRDGKFIADEYVLSYNTVKTHIKHIYQKLGIHSRQDLLDLVG